MNYKLTAITFADINQAYKFIAQENHKWVIEWLNKQEQKYVPI
jgi:hypothetical protein